MSSQAETSMPGPAATGAPVVTDSATPIPVREADFSPVQDEPAGGPALPISRFQDVQVAVTAELGKARLPIRKLLLLGAGSVIELDRPVSSPVELIANGVPLASGEVVVVNDCFAIRISEIYPGATPRSDA